VAATVIEEVTDIVRLEYLDQALVLGTVGLQALELVAAGTEGAGGGVAQGGNVLRRFQAGVDQILGQCTDDAVAPSIDLADLVRIDRKSTRLNSSHVKISYAVFCLKKKNVSSNPFASVTHQTTGD